MSTATARFDTSPRAPPMKRTVFGASGGISRQTVEQALAQGQPASGRDRLGGAITRADIAAFQLDQLTDTRFRRAAPAISS